MSDQSKTRKIQAVIFDLDGVLATTDHLHYQAWKRLADEIGADAYTYTDNIRQRGVSRMDSLEVVLEKVETQYQYSETEKVAMATRKNDYYVESLAALDETAILPGAKEALETLKLRGIPVALGSASKNALLILEKIGLADYFDAIASGHDTTRSKPDPEVFLVAAQKLGVAPEACLVVEDAEAGVVAAHRAGMKVLGVGPVADSHDVDYSGKDLSDPSIDWDEILA